MEEINKLSNKDFRFCTIIRESIRYVYYEEFIEKSIEIKRLYKKMTYNEKVFFKWYVYANTHISLINKDKIWDYLNEERKEETIMERRKKKTAIIK